MNRVIVCSPYAGDIEANVAYARRCLRHSFDQGEAPFASHLIYPQALDDTDPLERARAIQATFEWIHNCDLVAFYVDLGWSPGMLQELKCARLFFRRLEVRRLDAAVPRPEAELNIVKDLLDAGLVEEEPSPVEGVQVFRFRRDE
jgi:hypothetical protein